MTYESQPPLTYPNSSAKIYFRCERRARETARLPKKTGVGRGVLTARLGQPNPPLRSDMDQEECFEIASPLIRR